MDVSRVRFGLAKTWQIGYFGYLFVCGACQGGVSFQAFMQPTAKSTLFNDNFTSAASKINIEIKIGGGFGETKSA